jgi:hypothetical protein
MGTVAKTYTFSPGATIVAAEHNTNFDTLYTLVNGNISNTNVASDAAISITKVSIASTDPVYFGGATTAGSWKIYRSGDNLMFARYEGSVWVDKGGFTP